MRPFLKFRKYNGRLIPLADSSPQFSLTYRKGIEGFLDSEVDYDHVELGIESKINLGVRATYDFKLLTGTFFNDAATLRT